MDTIPTCRACLKTSLSYVDLETPFEQIELETPLEEHSNVLITYMDCFRSCTQLTATDNEGKMPQNLCENCSFELGIAWNFIQKAIQSDKVLSNAIANCKGMQRIDDSNGYDNKYIEIATVDDRSVRLEGLTKTENNKENISQTEDDLKDYVAIQQFPNTDLLENMAKEEERNNTTIKKSPSTNSMESEQYYFLELLDISENDEGKIIVNSTECDNDVEKSLKEDSSSSAIYCSICLQSFEKYSQLSLHSQTHTVVDDETSICKLCGNNVFKEDMPEHIKITHSNIIKCMYCDFKCPELKMSDHLHHTHSGPKNFVCNICGKIFTSLSILNSHLKYHQRKEANIKSDACEICSKRFSTKHYLRLHMEVHRNVRQLHQCNYCDKMYVSKIALDNHIRLHKGETIKCDECGKQFVRQYELNVHMRFHTRDYPFKCEICDKKFAIKGHLRTHMWRHQGLKLQCEECGKLFTSTKALQEHSFVHSEMPFPCSYCGRGYPSKQKFKVHLKTTHLIEFTEAELQKVTKSQTPKPLQRKKLTLVQADSVMKEVEVKTDLSPPQPSSRSNPRARTNQQLLVPRTVCSVCQAVIRRNVASVKCNSCTGWCHFPTCSGLRTTREWSVTYVAPCCRSLPPQLTTVASPTNTPVRQPPPRVLQLQQIPPTRHSLTPRITHGHPRQTRLLQFNCNGLQSKIEEIVALMNRERVSIAAVQETKLNSRSDLLSCAGFNVLRKDRERDGGGGLAFILHNTVQYRLIEEDIDPRDTTLECQGIAIRSGDVELEIFNIYIPPVTCCPTGYHPNIGALLRGENRMVLGDFNAHHDLWHSCLSNDRRGMELAEQIDDSTFCTMNDEAPTRVMGTCNSSPDITIASGGLINSITWRPMLTLASDHLPIIISIEKPPDFVSVDNRTFINFKKANWVGFTEFTESTFNALPIPTDVCVGERQFRKVIAAATARFIPAGRIAEIRPNFPAEAAVLANERDTLRHADPGDPRIRDLNLEIRRVVNQHKRTKWIEHLKSCNLSTGVSKLWATVKALSNPKRHDDRVEVQFNGRASSDPKKCASYFSRQFTLHPSVDKAKRCVNRRLRKMPNNCAPLTFTGEEVQSVITKAKSSKSIGPDGINMLMLKHLGSAGVGYLTSVLNLSLTTLQIPDVWKIGRVVPLLKPGKPANKGESYRPITLLSPVVKTLEALLLPTFTHHLSLASHQHGFRKVHSTTTALSVINTRIVRGLNQKPPCERTILVALDLSKAFDTVNHTTLLQDIEKTTLPPGLKRWTMNYLSGRQSSVLFRGETSKLRRIKQGVPQGGVLSPLLFNFYISKLPQPPEGVSITSYADDCTILTSGNGIDGMCSKVNSYLSDLSRFLTARNLQLSPTKSTATIFTNWTKEYRLELDIAVDGVKIPTVNNPKILGVTFDSLCSFTPHTTAIIAKVQSRNKILKSLAGSTWGKDKETLLATYKAIGRPVLNYAAPIWSPGCSGTQMRKLQTCQNTALRTTTGCLLMSPIEHLHSETRMLPVKEHNELLSRQFLLGCFRRNHPCSHLLGAEPPPRSIKRSFLDYVDDVVQYADRTSDATDFRQVLTAIHSGAINTFTDSLPVNGVLGVKAPPIADEELQLPRETRVTLAQLRSGYCSRLNSYLSRIDPDISNICPACNESPHDTGHLFACPTNPTHLTPSSLWSDPVETARFLGLPLDDLDDNTDDPYHPNGD